MLINNRIKKALSEHKEERMDIKKLDGEVSPSKPTSKKKKQRETHEIGEELVVRMSRVKDFSGAIVQRITAPNQPPPPKRVVWFLRMRVRVVEKWKNKSGREEYNVEVLEILPGDREHIGIKVEGLDVDNAIGKIVKIQAQ